MSDYYVTYSGVLIHPEDIRIENINLLDIGHHLTNIQRFGGGIPFDKLYSVAEHSIHIASYISKRINSMSSQYTKNTARMALLHDATEAYLGDVMSALKKQLPDYQKLENTLQSLIYEKYGVMENDNDAKAVKELDKRILLDEVAGIVPYRYGLFREKYKELSAIGITITGNNTKAETFIQFQQLCKELEIYD